MSIEFELKYRATEAQLSALAEAFPGEIHIYRMHTRYYDTADHALSGRKLTLRCRLENDRSVCTLKTPAGALARGEYEVERDSIEEAIPELCKLSHMPELLPLLAGGVAEVCGARFTRTAIRICCPEFTGELALDRGILTGGGRELPLCEAELELKSGSREAMCAFAAVLEKRFDLQPEKVSKFRRALSLAAEG